MIFGHRSGPARPSVVVMAKSLATVHSQIAGGEHDHERPGAPRQVE